MSRLLFAAARGARIQFSIYENEWYKARELDISGDDHWNERIHPADEHLQYGPISTAYREAAEIPEGYPNVLVKDVGAIYASIKNYNDYRQADNMTKQFYLLFLAEYLADEGL